MKSRIPAVALAAILGGLAAYACTSSGGNGNSDGGGTTSGPDAGTSVDAGQGDGKCHGDEGCKPSEYCELSTGKCLAAKPCQTNENCDSEEEGDYCAYGGCFCDTTRNGGSCRPRFHLCQACTRDEECGSDGFIYLNYTASCTADKDGTKVCLPLKQTGCPPGYVGSTGANCVPGGGSCSASQPCTKDDDCDATSERPVCDVKRGFCIPPCVFDYQRAQSDCPPGQVCHVDPRLLTASNPNFGGGRCGAPCDAATDPYVCPAGSDPTDARSLDCLADGDALVNTGELPKRCRPKPPHCVRDQDCPGDEGAHSKGYCDRATLDCSTGCRRDTDCDSGFHCLQNQCVQKTCIENGGAVIACAAGQFCCGEAGSPDCPTGVNQGQCYDAPNPPWCEVCQGGNGEKFDPPSPLSERPLPSRCWTTNGQPLLWISCKKGAQDGTSCPRAWKCEQNMYFCDDDSDCGPGGKCGQLQSQAGTFRACVCSNGESCPQGSGCNLKDQNGAPVACDAYWCGLNRCGP